MDYKLIYFSLRGLGEPIRLLLHDNGIAFKDDLVTDNWTELKPTMAFGQIPCLHEGNLQIVQSGAILRHLARKFNLYGSNEMESTMVDTIHEGNVDLRRKAYNMLYSNYENGLQPFLASLPSEIQNFEKLLMQNNDGKGFFVGNSPTYCDYSVFDVLEMMQKLEPDCLNEFPALKGFVHRMSERPNIVKYRENEAVKNYKFTASGHL